MRHPIAFAALLALPAYAKRPDLSGVATVPSIESVVTAEGFTPTPSQSEIYKPGAVLVPNGRGGHDVVVESCIDAEPSIAIMSQSSIATTLAGGVSARMGVARGAASAGVEKRLSFVDPEQRTISLGLLNATEACAQQVQSAARFQDLSDAVVLHDVLVAIIKNTVCTKADASGGVVALGTAEASAYSECVQESDGQVPLGYKAVPLSKVLSVAGTSTAPAAASVDFGGTASLDVDARLKAQACEQMAQSKGFAARQDRLRAATTDVQAQATSAWQGMEASLAKCTQLPRADRTDCVAMAEKWLEAARSMTVTLDAGVETVETDCGPRQPAFAAESKQVAAREVPAAEGMLVRLKAADAVTTPGVSGAGRASGSVSDSIEWVDLGKFAISKTEVTVAQYRACVEAGSCTKPHTDAHCNWTEPGRDNHPINCVEWSQAAAFAEWAGGRVPTKKEWVHASTSGGEEWDYPWGDAEATCARVVMHDGQNGPDGGGCGEVRTWPVCSKPAGHSAQGVCDLAGNVWEWTQERKGANRGYRGGGWVNSRASPHRGGYAMWGVPASRDYAIGIRVVR